MTELFAGIKHFHFIGIGGIGMSALAQMLIWKGLSVSGSDIENNPMVQKLTQMGAQVYLGHRPENIGSSEVVVFSSAIPPENRELRAAKKKGIPVIHRSELLAELMRFRKGITVTGTHGKTTTACLITHILLESGLRPDAVLGAISKGLRNNAVPGSGEFFVAEADESDRSFLIFSPLWTVVTNIDSDHLNAYKGLKDLVGCFTEHMNRIPFYGSVIACGSDPNLKEALRNVHRPVITYGMDADCDFSARSICPDGLKTRYSLYKGEHRIGEVSLALAGEHNVLNSVAAIIMGLLLGVPFSAINKALENFSGVHRRLEKKGEREGIDIFDDYGHHPSEIAATIKALKKLGRRIVVVFQPHRYSRTQQLMNEFDSCFSEADQLCLMEVYPAGEKPIKGVHSLELANRIRGAGEIHYCPSEEETLSRLKKIAVPGDVILTLGAGDVWKLGEAFLKNGC